MLINKTILEKVMRENTMSQDLKERAHYPPVMKGLVAILIALLLLLACTPQKVPSQKQSAEPDAMLTSFSGEVMVDDAPARQNMSLNDGMTVTTGSQSNAVITFLKGSVLRLDESSKITISVVSKEEIKLSQESGNSWSRLTRFGKPKEYVVETPFAVATVRGTAFGVGVHPDHATIKVKHGSVATTVETEEGVHEEVVDAGEQMGAGEEEFVVEAMEEDAWMEENAEFDEEFMEDAADEYFEEHEEEYADSMESMNLTEEQMEEWIEEWGEGDVAEPEPETQEDVEQLEEFMEEEAAEEAEEPVSEETEENTEEPVTYSEETPADEAYHEEIPPETTSEEPPPEAQADAPVDASADMTASASADTFDAAAS